MFFLSVYLPVFLLPLGHPADQTHHGVEGGTRNSESRGQTSVQPAEEDRWLGAEAAAPGAGAAAGIDPVLSCVCHVLLLCIMYLTAAAAAPPVCVQVIIGSLHVQDTDQQQSEAALWRRLAQEKGRELEGFHLELDSILDVLKHLQSAGWREAPTLSPPKPLNSTDRRLWGSIVFGEFQGQ